VQPLAHSVFILGIYREGKNFVKIYLDLRSGADFRIESLD